jgi:hypothetical protein
MAARRSSIGPSVVVALAAALALWSCGDRSRPTIPVFGNLAVLSDPAGAQVAVDGRIFEGTTPVTLEGIEAGQRYVELAFVPGPAEFFGWEDTVTVPEEAVDTIRAALEGGCERNCPFLIDRGRIICRSTGNGDTCASVFYDGIEALEWPNAGGGAYGAGGRLLFAGILDENAGALAGDTLSTQLYDVAWTGRQPMVRSSSGNRQQLELEYWGTARYRSESLTGLSVRQTLIAVDSARVNDVLFVRFEIENVSGDERYRRLYPWVPEGGFTYESLYAGFGFDPDVGQSENDLGTFDPSLNLSFMYDAHFQDEALGANAERPALVGLVTVEPPAGASERTFTLWRRVDDWDDGDAHAFAWRLLAGRLAPTDPIADHPSPEIGHAGTTPNDYRLTEAYGPLRLGPGDTATLTVALLFADPVAGTYTPGILVPPGDPTDMNRQILAVADSLRALAEQVPELWNRYRP